MSFTRAMQPGRVAVMTWAALLLLAAIGPALAQPITNFPPADLPLSGAEQTYIVQGGVSKKTTVGNLLASVSITGLPNAPSNAALKGFAGGSVQTVYRAGFTTAGDGGAAYYTWSPSTCSLNSGAGDNGSQVAPGSGIGCWLWSPVSNTVGPEVFGAKGDGASNDTAAIQATINAAETSSGGVAIVNFSAKSYLYTPPLSVTNTVWLRGQGNNATFLQAVPGSSSNWINVGYLSGQVNGVKISDMTLAGSAPTGGYAISSHNVGRLLVSNINVGNGPSNAPFCGIEDNVSNYDSYEFVWGYTRGTNCQAFFWHATPPARSDQLLLHNVAFNAGFYGNDGIVLEGMVQTINAQNIAFLQTNHGFWVNASQNTTSAFPGFGSIYNLQVEGAQSAACEIDGGRQFYFSDGFCHSEYGETGPGGNQGNNDAAALLINPDFTESVTSDLKFENMSIGLSANFAGLMQAQGAYFSNVSWRGSSLKTPEGAPSVQINGTPGQGSADYAFVNNKFCGIFGDQIQDNFGLVRGANVGSVHLTGSSFNYCQVGEVVDNSASFSLISASNTDRGANPLPNSAGFWISNSTPTVVSCGTSPIISGNNLVGSVVVGSGSVTSCQIQFASSNSALNNGLGRFQALFLASTTPGVSYISTATTPTGFTIQRADGGNMAGEVIPWKASQGTN